MCVVSVVGAVELKKGETNDKLDDDGDTATRSAATNRAGTIRDE